MLSLKNIAVFFRHCLSTPLCKFSTLELCAVYMLASTTTQLLFPYIP